MANKETSLKSQPGYGLNTTRGARDNLEHQSEI